MPRAHTHHEHSLPLSGPMGDGAAPPRASLGLVAGTFSLSLLVPVWLSVAQPLWLRTWA